MVVASCEAGNPLASVFRAHARYWWPIVEDTTSAQTIQRLVNALEKDLAYMRECSSVSIDDTVKVCMPMLG